MNLYIGLRRNTNYWKSKAVGMNAEPNQSMLHFFKLDLVL